MHAVLRECVHTYFSRFSSCHYTIFIFTMSFLRCLRRYVARHFSSSSLLSKEWSSAFMVLSEEVSLQQHMLWRMI